MTRRRRTRGGTGRLLESRNGVLVVAFRKTKRARTMAERIGARASRKGGRSSIGFRERNWWRLGRVATGNKPEKSDKRSRTSTLRWLPSARVPSRVDCGLKGSLEDLERKESRGGARIPPAMVDCPLILPWATGLRSHRLDRSIESPQLHFKHRAPSVKLFGRQPRLQHPSSESEDAMSGW